MWDGRDGQRPRARLSAAAGAAPGRGAVTVARILVAEDDEAVRAFVARALQRLGHEVRVAGDGLQALNALSAGSYDLLVSDIVMPGMDGIALALKVARDWPGTGILLMSGYAHERQRAHNLDALSHEVLSKPFTLQDLTEAVGRVLTTDEL